MSKVSLIQNYDTVTRDEYPVSKDLVAQAHEYGMLVHPYVFQDDFLKFTDNAISEMDVWFEKDIDGIFVETGR